MNQNELLRRVGRIEQVAGCRHYELAEGRSKGLRMVDIKTGGGLRYSVAVDRGLDITLADYKSTNIAFLTAAGEVNPAYCDHRGLEWLKTFSAGLLTTCGLSSFGPPCEDEGETLGLHGRYSSLPASQFCDRSRWEDGRYIMEVSGTVEEASLFGHRLRLHRRVRSHYGENTIHIHDEVENFGSKPSPLQLLYHINLGYPLLDKSSRLHCKAQSSEARDDEAEQGKGEMFSFSDPIPNAQEQVYFHKQEPDAEGWAKVILENPELNGGMAVQVAYQTANLPCLTQWKLMGDGEYVLGIEPCNVHCHARDTLRKNGQLPMLAPGERKSFEVKITVAEGANAAEQLLA